MRSASSAFGEVNRLRAEKKELLAAITRLETTIYARDETIATLRKAHELNVRQAAELAHLRKIEEAARKAYAYLTGTPFRVLDAIDALRAALDTAKEIE